MGLFHDEQGNFRIDPGGATLAASGISAIAQLFSGGLSKEEEEALRAKTGLTKAQTERLGQLMKQSGASFDMLPGLESKMQGPIDTREIAKMGPMLQAGMQPMIRGLTQKFNSRFGASSPHAAGAVMSQVANVGAGRMADLYGAAYKNKLSNLSRIYSGRTGLAA